MTAGRRHCGIRLSYAERLHRPRLIDQTALVGASTPFVTGRPSTLFHNGEILSTGAVGLAISRPSAPEPVPVRADAVGWHPASTTDTIAPHNVQQPSPLPTWLYPGLHRLGGQMRATGVFGNVVRTLNGQPATAKLLELMRDPAALKPCGDGDSLPTGAPAYEDHGGEVYVGVVRAEAEVRRWPSGIADACRAYARPTRSSTSSPSRRAACRRARSRSTPPSRWSRK